MAEHREEFVLGSVSAAQGIVVRSRFAIQALGLLAGSFMSKGMVRDYGFLFWAVNPEIMLPGNDFKQHMSQYVREMKALPKRAGVTEIRIPSERASKERERRRVEGIVVKRKVIESLKAL